MQTVSSKMTRPPDPRRAPTEVNVSIAICTSRLLAAIGAEDTPAGCAALNGRPSIIPPHTSNTIVRRVIPIGTSIMPGRLMWPLGANTLVPLLLAVPMLLYHSAPRLMISGMFEWVSTLFIQVGLAQTPRSVERTSFGRGIARRPSIEDIIADDSPAAYDPPPTRTWMLNENSVPRMFLPTSPR